MPVYYLHVCNGDGFTEDEEGQEFADTGAALAAARAGLRDISANELRAGQLNMASFIEVEDENRRLVATVTFLDAVQVETRHGKRPGR
jgi:hypothetical protein